MTISMRDGQNCNDGMPDGSFSAAGIPPGRLDLTPFLPATLKVLDPRTLTYTASADECGRTP